MTHEHDQICTRAHEISQCLTELRDFSARCDDPKFPHQPVREMYNTFHDLGCISARQLQWMRSLHGDYCGSTTVDLPDSFMATIMMLQFSSSKILTPKMIFTINDAGDRLALIWHQDKRYATVTNGWAFSNPASYRYGSLNAKGRLTLRGGASRRHEWPDVLAFLSILAADPIQAAKTSAARTGRCTFCNAELTDPISKQHGYGETCARNWDLPYADHITRDTLMSLFNKATKVGAHG